MWCREPTAKSIDVTYEILFNEYLKTFTRPVWYDGIDFIKMKMDMELLINSVSGMTRKWGLISVFS